MSDLQQNTVLVDQRDGLWRMRVYPDVMQLFRSRELAEARAREIACSNAPPWTVIVRQAHSD